LFDKKDGVDPNREGFGDSFTSVVVFGDFTSTGFGVSSFVMGPFVVPKLKLVVEIELVLSSETELAGLAKLKVGTVAAAVVLVSEADDTESDDLNIKLGAGVGVGVEVGGFSCLLDIEFTKLLLVLVKVSEGEGALEVSFLSALES
jgi:hypothetical protein